MQRVVTYVRVSTEDQALKDLSIPAQRKCLVRWVAEEGAELVREFVDQGESAYAPAQRRPGFMDMIQFCTKNRVDVLLVHKFDRFSRYKEEATFFKSKLRNAGVKVQSVSEELDPETPHGFLQETLIEGFAQYFSMNLSSEVLKGMRQNAETGFFNGGPAPYGYRVEHTSTIPGQTRGRLVLGPEEEVATVRRIFDLAVNHGLGAKAIANVLNGEGVPGKRSASWSGSSVSKLLVNPVYVGDLVWFKSKKRGRTGRQLTDRGDRIVTPDAHPAIIDRALFEARQAQAAERAFDNRSSAAQPTTWLLSRLIVCSHCGHHYVGRRYPHKTSQGKVLGRGTYTCAGYLFKGKSVCPGLSISSDWLEGWVLELLRARLCEPDAQAGLQALLRGLLEQQKATYTRDAATLQRRVAETDAAIERYYRAIGAGTDLAICQRFIAELTEKKAALLREVEVMQADDFVPSVLARNAALLARFSELFGAAFDRLEPTIKRQALLHFVERIEVVEHQKVRVHLIMPFHHGGLRELVEAAERAMKAGDGSAAAGFAGGGEGLGDLEGAVWPAVQGSAAKPGPSGSACIPRRREDGPWSGQLRRAREASRSRSSCSQRVSCSSEGCAVRYRETKTARGRLAVA